VTIIAALRKGQCLKPLHAADANREWGVSSDAVGAVLCSYRVLLDRSHLADRVDVLFDDGHTIWGAPACVFTLVEEGEDTRRY
jgi:hypothetical protein